MVKSIMDDQGKIFDLTDYSFAKEVIKSHPKILAIYQKLLPVLYHHAVYQCVWPVIQIVEDSQLLAQMQLQFYKEIYRTKGIVKPKEK